VSPSPFGTLNIPGNALLSYDNDPNNTGPPSFVVEGRELLPTSPLTIDHSNPYTGFDGTPTSIAASLNPGDYLHPPTSTIFARRTSVSAESIAVDSTTDEPLPVYPRPPINFVESKYLLLTISSFRDLGRGARDRSAECYAGADGGEGRGCYPPRRRRRIFLRRRVWVFALAIFAQSHCHLHGSPIANLPRTGNFQRSSYSQDIIQNLAGKSQNASQGTRSASWH